MRLNDFHNNKGPLPEATPTDHGRIMVVSCRIWLNLVGFGRIWSDLVRVGKRLGRI